MIRFLSAVLALSAVALSAVLAQAWDSVYRPAATVAGHQDTAEVAMRSLGLGSSEFQLPPQAAFDDFIERPLFSVDRRPHDPPAEETLDLQRVALKSRRRQNARMILTGIVINGEDRFALLREPRGGSVALLRTGGAMEGWEVVEIHPDSVTLNDGSVTEELPLRTFEAPPLPKKKAARAEPEPSDEQVVASAAKTE